MSDRDRVRESAPEYALRHRRFTFEDYCRLPSGCRYELVDGELMPMPSPNTFHQEISKRLGRKLLEQVEDAGLGVIYFCPTDVMLGPEDVVQPDILCILKERLSIVTESSIQGSPDLVVEILSPSTAEWDRVVKRRAYSLYGVKEMWIVDPEANSIEVALHNGTELVTAHKMRSRQEFIVSRVIPDLRISLGDLFRR